MTICYTKLLAVFILLNDTPYARVDHYMWLQFSGVVALGPGVCREIVKKDFPKIQKFSISIYHYDYDIIGYNFAMDNLTRDQSWKSPKKKW
jgi:hypothetical protein